MLMMKCTQATYLMSKETETPLTKKERLGLWLHNIYCVHCRRFRASITLLKRVLTIKSVKTAFDDVEVTERLTDSTKAKIKAALK
ncbi:MAG: hypothetical protein OCC49_18590 [Fibrobacterales bacterium]